MPANEDYWKDPEKAREKSLAYYYANREKVREKQKEYYRQNLEKRKESAKRNREKNIDYYKEKQKEYYRKNREYRLSYAKIWRESNPTYNIDRILKKYNLTRERYELFLKQQEGGCAICGDILTKLFVDHDHKCCSEKSSCGKCVRGLLCMVCNYAIGLLRDDENRILKTAEYLKKYNQLAKETVI